MEALEDLGQGEVVKAIMHPSALSWSEYAGHLFSKRPAIRKSEVLHQSRFETLAEVGSMCDGICNDINLQVLVKLRRPSWVRYL